MKDSKINAFIAITALVAAILMALALSFAIGKWGFNGGMHTLTVDFPSASGINSNSIVKLAGAPIGRVKSIKLIPLEEQTEDPLTKLYNSVAVVIEISPTAPVQEGSTVTVRQDGIGLSPQYVLITPGRNHQAKLLENGATLQGEAPVDMSGLVQSVSNTLLKVDALVDDMQPAMAQLKTLSATMNEHLPPFLTKSEGMIDNLNALLSTINSKDDPDKLKKLVANLNAFAVNGNVAFTKATLTLDRADPTLDQLKTLSTTLNEHMPDLLTRTEKLVDNGNGLVSAVGSPEQQEKIRKLITNLGVISDNLKVVTANAEALTATLAQTPWRVVWGGKTIQPPPAEVVLKSDKPIPLQTGSSSSH